LGRLRVLSRKEVCTILANHGFLEVRRRGSHIVRQKKLLHSHGKRQLLIPGSSPERIIRVRGQLECLAVERLVNISLKQVYVSPPEPK